jgi:hypothetical protein
MYYKDGIKIKGKYRDTTPKLTNIIWK